MLVADREHCLFERTPLHFGEESRQFLLGSQMKPLDLHCGPDPAPAAGSGSLRDAVPDRALPAAAFRGRSPGRIIRAGRRVCGKGTVTGKMAKANTCKA